MFWMRLQECLLTWFVEQSVKSLAVWDAGCPISPGREGTVNYSTLSLSAATRRGLGDSDETPK